MIARRQSGETGNEKGERRADFSEVGRNVHGRNRGKNGTHIMREGEIKGMEDATVRSKIRRGRVESRSTPRIAVKADLGLGVKRDGGDSSRSK